MADERTATRRIIVGANHLNQQQVPNEIRECISRNEQMQLRLTFRNSDRLDAIVEMQNTIVENIVHIKKIVICNYCKERNQNIRCFSFFVKLVQESIGEEKKFQYFNFMVVANSTVLFEHVNQLADALRSTNNTGAIESFSFHDSNLNSITFQPLWDALLVSGVRKVELVNPYEYREYDYSNNTNGTINFTSFRTNTSIQELYLDFSMSKHKWKQLFDAIAVNKGLEKLEFSGSKVLVKLDLILLFKQMIRTNTSLLNVALHYRGTAIQFLDDLKIEINIQIKLNRMWKRYISRRQWELKKTSAAATVITTTINEEEEKRKKRLKMRLLLQFIKKPALRVIQLSSIY